MPHTSVLRVGSWGVCMPAGLKRYYGHGDLHFLTFSCYQRLPLLGTARARSLFVETLGKIRERYGFLLVGYVVMPEHVHLLISEPSQGTPSIVLKVLKQRVSRELREWRQCARAELLPQPFTGDSDGLERFWQPRFYDFNVYSAKKKREKLEYMHGNPVTRGLVEHPKDWPWSSFSFYARGEMGLVPVDLVG